MPRQLPIVVLVGRPNVGKSTLFNRMTGTRRAIVTPIAGTTRDALAHPVPVADGGFLLTDTGGMFGQSADPLHALVVEQGQRALATADLVVFVVDGREGLVPGDEDIAQAVRATGKPVLLAINKTDDRRAAAGVLDLYRLGFDPVVEVSAEHGRGVGDLLDEIKHRLPAPAAEDDTPASDEAARHGTHHPDELKVAIVGRPNAGKSSLVNRLLREERMIVSPVPGTTRDPVDSVFAWHKKQVRIVDTAGMRKAGRVASGGALESLSVMLARRAIADADVVVLVIDVAVGPTDQDAAIAGEADAAGRGVVVALNKWDLLPEHTHEAAEAADGEVRRRLPFLDYAPIVHISAKTGERTPKLLEIVDRVATERRKRVPTPALNRFIAAITAAQPPVSDARRAVRILFASQTGVAPPTFVLFTNVAATMHFSYLRYLTNRLREEYGFAGTPIRLHIRRRVRKGTAPDGA
ncbi:MAG: ribosome biogenesis GTPase Der [Acidobacteria bacterium]|nr:ribosome biogenesis GTPase Der [Acidobacteriota bacterium]